jgi:hypothetical protein
MVRFAVLFGAASLLSASTVAVNAMGGGSCHLPKTCAVDLDSLCAGVSVGEGRRVACLKAEKRCCRRRSARNVYWAIQNRSWSALLRDCTKFALGRRLSVLAVGPFHCFATLGTGVLASERPYAPEYNHSSMDFRTEPFFFGCALVPWGDFTALKVV